MSGTETHNIDNFWTRYSQPPLPARLLMVLLVFIQFYPTKLVFLPVTLRVLLSALGMVLLVFKYIKAAVLGQGIVLDKRFLMIVMPLALMTLLSAATLNLNGTSDPMYLYYFTTSFLMLASGYLTINIMHVFYKKSLSFEIIAYYCILAVVCQLAFGLVSYLDKPLVVPLLLKTEEGLLQLKSTDTGRFIGLGQYFMNLGVANGFALLLIGILLKNAAQCKISPKIKFLLTLFFIFIAVLGNMQARTTTICAIIVLAYMVLSTIKFNLATLRAGLGQIIMTLFLLVGLLCVVIYYWGDRLSQYHDAINYGFELFVSAEDGNGPSTHSSDMLKWMLTIWPTTDKTWLIGDGQYFVDGGGYYMRTDVGYARLIFYFGVFGMLIFFIYQTIVTRIAFRDITKGWKGIWFYVYLTILIINIKSCVDYTFYVSLFFSYNILYNKETAVANLNIAAVSSRKRIDIA